MFTPPKIYARQIENAEYRGNQTFLDRLEKTINLILSDPNVRREIEAARARRLVKLNVGISEFLGFEKRILRRKEQRKKYKEKMSRNSPLRNRMRRELAEAA